MVLMCVPLLQAAAQGGAASSNAQNAVDYRSRSDVKVDPATGALQLRVTLGSYKGRSGLDLPVTLSYSSKVWEMRHHGTIFRGSECQDCQGEPDATYHASHAMYSAGGWTSSLDWFKWGEPPSFETYDEMGRPCTSGCTTKIARLYIKMPDGSRHEFMKDNFFHPLGSPPSGTYHSVDGSRVRYDASSGTLYLPDGSRHQRVQDEDGVWRRYTIDRHGNRLVYDETARLWKDTLGREFGLPPLDASAPAERTYSLPGLSAPFKFVWKRLGDDGVRTNPNQELHYTGDRTGTWPHTPVFPHLFTSPNPNDSVTDGNGERFNPVLLHRIELPNGTAYTFTYNVYGEIDKVVYPTGGYERFVHGQASPLSSKVTDLSPGAQTNRGVHLRFVSVKGDGSDEVPWSYNSGPGAFVVSPDNTRTEMKFHVSDGETVLYGYDNPLVGRAYEEKVVSAGNQFWRRKLTHWVTDGATHQSGPLVMHVRRNPRVAKEVSIILDRLGNALSATTEYEYDADLNVKKVKRYDYREVSQETARTAPIGDFPAGNLLRVEETDYLTDNQEYRNRQMLSLPTATRVKDAAGAVVAQTAFSYDEPSIGLHPCGATKGWVDPATSFHGNATTAKRWLSTPGAWIETHAEYDRCGNLRKSRDAHDANAPEHGRVSEVFYDDAFSDSVNRNTYAYPTKTVSAVPDESGQRGSSAPFDSETVYDFVTGLVTSTTDANDKITRYFYTTPGGTPDPLHRLGRVERPDGGWTSYEYGDAPGDFFVLTRTALDGARSTESYQYFDGLGGASRSYTRDGASAERAWVAVKMQRDEVNRKIIASNPHFRADLNDFDLLSTTNTVPATTTTTDPLGRATSVVTQDGAAAATKYDGVEVTATDPAGRKRSSLSDALGRLLKVVEAPGVAGYGFETAYEYDVLGNLKKVTQGKAGQTQQTRTFVYDSLSRLVSATNPEACAQQPGGTCAPTPSTYEYDPSGTLRKKIDARGVQTEYDYDGLNRPKSRRYTLAPGAAAPPNYVASPGVDYYYDGRGMPSEAGVPLPTPEDAKGLLTAVKSSVSHTAYTEFDVMGRVERHRQITEPGTEAERTYKTGYTYDLAGNLTSQTYPSGKVVVTEYDSANRVAGVKNDASGFYYAGAAPADVANRMKYAAHGAAEAVRLGNGLWERTQYNSRLQPERAELGTAGAASDRWRLDYGYGTASENNGNVRSQTVTVPALDGAAGFTAVQAYEYDALNRIETARETQGTAGGAENWKQRFTYDHFGNRRIDGDAANPSTSQTTPTLIGPNPLINPATNRLSSPGYSYDAAGNLTGDARHTYEYDSENRMAANDRGGDPSVAAVYAYDGDGRRVRKVAGAGTGAVITVFVYDAAGRLVAEYSNATPPASTGGKSYLTQDHLGSTRVVTDNGGQIRSRHDYVPFGEEVGAGVGGRITSQGYSQLDGVRQKFIGSERDDETGLDYMQARYYASMTGRFTSPDPLLNSGRPTNPASWNRYSYSLNNPLRFIDPSGLYEYEANATDKQKKRFEAQLKAAKKSLEKIAKRYGDTSDEYKDAKRALDAYGDPNKANGVIVAFAATSTGKPGETSGGTSVGSNVLVTINIDSIKDDGNLGVIIGHEGSHAQDRADFRDAFSAALASDPTDAKGSLSAVINGSLNMTSNATETKAFGVSSVLAEFLLKNEAPPASGGGTFVMSNKQYAQQSISVGGVNVWNPSWAAVDVKTVRQNRSSAIATGLKNDPHYSAQANKKFAE